MRPAELMLYERLYDEIYERAEEISNDLNLSYNGSTTEVDIGKGFVHINIVDGECDTVDSLKISYEDFCGYDYCVKAKVIRERDLKEKEEKRRKEREAQKAREKEERKAMYLKLRKEFEEETKQYNID